jgi:hypothetical protein
MDIEKNVHRGRQKRQFSKIPSENRKNIQSPIGFYALVNIETMRRLPAPVFYNFSATRTHSPFQLGFYHKAIATI